MFLQKIKFQGRPVYLYGRRGSLQNAGAIPLILDLNCTGGNPQTEAIANGWDQLAEKENFLVAAPEYNNFVLTPEVPFMYSLIQMLIEHYSIDQHRIYSVGFSNGGALSGVLASYYPNLLAGIGAMGWCVGYPRHKNVEIPFVLIQGTREYPGEINGFPAVNGDERQALHDIFQGNQMLTEADYRTTPVWGYRPDKTVNKTVSYISTEYTSEKTTSLTAKLTFSYYLKSGFIHPFITTVLMPDETHRLHSCNAVNTWESLKHFARDDSGKIMELS